MLSAVLISLFLKIYLQQITNLDPDYQIMDVTAYCDHGQMASGKYVYSGAVANNKYPFGTKLEIKGYGKYIVEDRIGWGSELDIYMPNCNKAKQFGRKKLKVRVIK